MKMASKDKTQAPPLSRRDILRLTGSGLIVTAAASALPVKRAFADGPKRGGKLTLGSSQGSTTDTTDPALKAVPPAGVQAVSSEMITLPATIADTDDLSGSASFSNPFLVRMNCSASNVLSGRDTNTA